MAKKDPASVVATTDAIIDLFLQKVSKKEQQVARTFATGFFKRTAYVDIEKLPAQAIGEIIDNLWRFFRQRTPGQPMVDVYTFRPDNTEKSSRLIINIVNDNMPFLVDSVVGFLSSLGLRARILMRPLYHSKRNAQGIIVDILENSNLHSDYHTESVIHCEIADPVSEDVVAILKSELPNIQRDIGLAVADWLRMRNKVQETIADLRPIPNILDTDQVAEIIDFLQWMGNDHFTFLGYREYGLKTGKKLYEYDPANSLGILASPCNQEVGVLYHGVQLNSDTLHYIFQSEAIVVTKTTRMSTVHRVVPMDSISIKKFDKKGQVIGIRQFVGLFTSMAYSSSARDIPLLRRKVLKVVERAGYSYQSHDGKAIIHILDTLPRDELFQASEQELEQIASRVLSIHESPQVALFIRRDHFNRFLSCLVYVPRARFDYELTESMGKLLEEILQCPVTLSSAQYGSLSFARVHYMVVTSRKMRQQLNYDIPALEKKLAKLAHSWRDGLRLALNEEYGEWDGTKMYHKYKEAFAKGYQERFDEQEAVKDIAYIERACSENTLQVRLYRPADKPADVLKLKLYNAKGMVPLSDALPTLANMDLRVLGEVPFTVHPDQNPEPVWIHDFETVNRGRCEIDIAAIKKKFLTMFNRVWHRDVENDGFNRLVTRAGLDWNECTLMRAYCKYLRQIQIPFSQEYMEDTLTRNPKIVRLIKDLFITRFHPNERSNAEGKAQVLSEQIAESLNQVKNLDEDRILRHYANLVMATLRTNYYQLTAEGNNKPYLSFKFDSKVIEGIPNPKPLYEIFVYSPRFEAVHLRGGKIARGGIRWSDRREDFRTEILGLVKAQMVKNAVIVPTGSKGGFVLKNPTELMTREELLLEGKTCYQLMMNALLELTDNLVKNKVVPPKDTVRIDGDDPYLVVAADKGTATFSDIANAVAEEKEFWLGDAFASGGSAGYDHKKIGITARGAWESVRRHFWEMGIDVNTTELTTVGIGDMGGDVFGNGMLLSKKLKLLAAFNHRHIFFDPNPDPAKSFVERKRLFKERKGWDGYNQKLLSKGGGIFERSAKVIKLSKEMRNVLNLNKAQASPSQIIQAILQMQVDLMWFGGIGTFVKSRYEGNLDIGDRYNDSVRINAEDLNCKVIGEGANLGITQKGRIEFAKKGGRINTDAIDNSGGVDCSDHEVNIKILLQMVMGAKKITLKERNKLLVKMTNEVASLVLRNNYAQNLAISLIRAQGIRLLAPQTKLMRKLEKSGRLDRTLEYLPDDTTLVDYQTAQIGLWRPEVAVLMPYAKNSLYEELVVTKVPAEPMFTSKLQKYFPKPLQENYASYIDKHPLKREIVSTIVANEMINRMGGSFINDVHEKTSRQVDDIVRAYYISCRIYGLDEMWDKIDTIKNKVAPSLQQEAFLHVVNLMRRSTKWMLRNFPSPMDVQAICTMFKEGVKILHDKVNTCLVGSIRERLENDIEFYRNLGLSNTTAKHFALTEVIASSPDIILIANNAKTSVHDIAALYFTLGSRFGFNRYRQMADNLTSNNSWHRDAVNSVIEDLYFYQGVLTTKVIDFFKKQKVKVPTKGANAVTRWTEHHESQVARIDQLIADSQSIGSPDLALLTVIKRELRMLSEM